MPDLVVSNSGSDETVSDARDEWTTAGFAAGNFSPNGHTNDVVTGQTDGLGNDLTPGVCYPITQKVVVTYR